LNRAFPGASLVVKNGNLHSITKDDVTIICGSYSVEVTVETKPKQWVGKVTFNGLQLGRWEDVKESNVRACIDDFCTKLGGNLDVVISVTEEEVA